MKNVRNSICLLVVFGCLVLACGGGKPAPAKYQGHWKGTDGSTLYMESNGGAGFEFKSKSVSGGSATFDEPAKTLTISMMGIGNTWTIDEEPNDKGEMKLSGTIYRKE